MHSGSSEAEFFGGVLAAAREHMGLTQSDVAALIGMSMTAVSMAEQGKRPPREASLVRRYARALEVDEEALRRLWWAAQGMVTADPQDFGEPDHWWRDLEMSAQGEASYEEWSRLPDGPPDLAALGLAERLCSLLDALLPNGWSSTVDADVYLPTGADDPRPCAVVVLVAPEVDPRAAGRGRSRGARDRYRFRVPEPARPPGVQASGDESDPAGIGWFVSQIEALNQRQQMAVASFIRGLQAGAQIASNDPF